MLNPFEEMMVNYVAGTGMVSAPFQDTDASSYRPGDRVGDATVEVRGANRGAIHAPANPGCFHVGPCGQHRYSLRPPYPTHPFP